MSVKQTIVIQQELRKMLCLCCDKIIHSISDNAFMTFRIFVQTLRGLDYKFIIVHAQTKQVCNASDFLYLGQVSSLPCNIREPIANQREFGSVKLL